MAFTQHVRLMPRLHQWQPLSGPQLVRRHKAPCCQLPPACAVCASPRGGLSVSQRLIHYSATQRARCFWLLCRQVLGVYKGRRWAFIEEHLHDVLGRTAKEGGDLQAALQVGDTPRKTDLSSKATIRSFWHAMHSIA